MYFIFILVQASVLENNLAEKILGVFKYGNVFLKIYFCGSLRSRGRARFGPQTPSLTHFL